MLRQKNLNGQGEQAKMFLHNVIPCRVLVFSTSLLSACAWSSELEATREQVASISAERNTALAELASAKAELAGIKSSEAYRADQLIAQVSNTDGPLQPSLDDVKEDSSRDDALEAAIRSEMSLNPTSPYVCALQAATSQFPARRAARTAVVEGAAKDLEAALTKCREHCGSVHYSITNATGTFGDYQIGGPVSASDAEYWGAAVRRNLEYAKEDLATAKKLLPFVADPNGDLAKQVKSCSDEVTSLSAKLD